MAPETRSKTRRVTRSGIATALAKEKCGKGSVAVAKMPPKREGKNPVKVTKKRRVAKGKRTSTVKEGEDNRRKGLCPVCRVLDRYHKLTKNGQRTNEIRMKKNHFSKKNINTAYVRQKGVKQRIST
jgi:hypothetical protein